jgi:hypothetical protein
VSGPQQDRDQPTLDLPPYHGRTPTVMKTSITGAGNRIVQSHGIGDRIVVLVEAKVRQAAHEETDKDGLVYIERLKVVDFFELDGEQGRKLLVEQREAYRLADDERLGRVGLPFENPPAGEVGLLDENGHPLDEDALAEIRGDRDALDELERGRGGVGEPWAGFEQSGAREIIGHIKALTVADEAVAVASWEEEHGGRQSVMQAAMKRAAELGGGV